MRTLRRNKQQMYYSIPIGDEPVYETDEYGDVIYVTDELGTHPIEIGEDNEIFDTPKPFRSNISGQLKQTLMREFGVVASPNYAQLVTDKGEFNFPLGTLIWKKSEPVMVDGKPDKASADYSIIGILDEFINEDTYFLHKRQ